MKLVINGMPLEVEDEKISQASEKGELIIANEDVIIKTKQDYDDTINNLTGERYRAGKEKAEKDAVTSLSKEYGIELDDTKKTVKNFASALKSKIEQDAKVEPETKLKEALAEKEKALTIAQDWESKFNNLSTSVKENEKKLTINSKIQEAIPRDEKGNQFKTKIPVSDVILLYANSRKITLDEEGKEEILINGQKLQNPNNLNNITIKEDFNSFFKNYVQVEGGNGGDDSTGKDNPGTLAAFEKEMKDKGIVGVKYNEEMKKRVENGTLKF